MKRHIKFPLFMKDNIPVRTMEELRNHFDVWKLQDYFANGRLAIWLRDRYEDELCKSIMALDPKQNDLMEQLCCILGIQYDNSEQRNWQDVLSTIERRKKILQYTNRAEVLDAADSVAFTQEELESIAENGTTDIIWLLGDQFELPVLHRKVTIQGLNGQQKPHVEVSFNNAVSLFKTGSRIMNADFDTVLVEAALHAPTAESLQKSNFAYSQNEFDDLMTNKADTIFLCTKKLTLCKEPYSATLVGCLPDAELIVPEQHFSGFQAKMKYRNLKPCFRNIDGSSVFWAKQDWIILSYSPDKTVLITKKSVKIMKQGDGKVRKLQWNESEIHQWLNDSFICESFTKEQAALLIPVEEDLVTLMSEKDAKRYSEYLLRYPTYEEEWLRDSSSSNKHGYFSVVSFGEKMVMDRRCVNTEIMLRPMICVKNWAALLSEGGDSLCS